MLNVDSHNVDSHKSGSRSAHVVHFSAAFYILVNSNSLSGA